MKTAKSVWALCAACLVGGAVMGTARASAEQPLVDSNATPFLTFASMGDGFTASGNTLVGQSPSYYSLPETQPGDFGDNAWSYYTVHPVDLWRYAYAGQTSWTDYTASTTVKVDRPATTRGFRGGETFFNYQWGREAVGTDAELIVRYTDLSNYYAVRISTGFKHIELWKTHGGVVQVKPFDFEPGTPYKLSVTASGPWLRVSVDGKKIFNYYDPVEPLLTGKVGFGVRESQTEFSSLEVVPAKADTQAEPVHHADFRVREWVGKKYIFDGDEPIAWFYWNPTEGMEFREMKMTPGLMPLILPAIGINSYRYTTGGILNVTKQGKTFAFSADQTTKDGGFTCHSDWVLTYNPGSGYVWDKRVHFVALKDKTEAAIQIDDPFFYQMVAPQTDKLPKARTVPNYCIFNRNDGKEIAFPAAHHLWTDGLAQDGGYTDIIAPDGYAVPVVDGWGIAMQFPKDNKVLHYVGFCHWGLDFHIQCVGTPAYTKDSVYDGHMIITLWDKAKVKAEYAKGVLPEPKKQNWAELFNNVEPVNHMSDLSPGLTGESVRLWTGNYTVDHKVGRNDSTSMRIDAKDITKRVDGPYGDERPNIWLGSSYWTGPYLAPKYRFGMWIKADDFHGTVKLRADDLNWPKAHAKVEYETALPINGKCDWTYISFESDFPSQVFNWVMRIDAVGTGTVWVDDIEVTPLGQPSDARLASSAGQTAATN